MDLFEKKIMETSFVPSEPAKGHSGRFEQRLVEHFGHSKSIRWHIPAYAASIILLVSVLSILFFNNKTSEPNLILSLENEEFIESEIYFQQLVKIKVTTIENLNLTTSTNLSEIKEFDESLKNLQEDLLEAPGDERVVEAVLNTYMLKIEALENIVTILKKQAIIL